MNTTRRRVDRLRSGERREPRRSAKHISESLAGRVRESTALPADSLLSVGNTKMGEQQQMRCCFCFAPPVVGTVREACNAMQCSAVLCVL